jgi:hypothetical protein
VLRNPIDQVLGIHIKSDKPQPGMNMGATICSHGTTSRKVYEKLVDKGAFQLYESAIICLTDTMLVFHGTQLSVTAGILIFGGYLL